MEKSLSWEAFWSPGLEIFDLAWKPIT